MTNEELAVQSMVQKWMEVTARYSKGNNRSTFTPKQERRIGKQMNKWRRRIRES